MFRKFLQKSHKTAIVGNFFSYRFWSITKNNFRQEIINFIDSSRDYRSFFLFLSRCSTCCFRSFIFFRKSIIFVSSFRIDFIKSIMLCRIYVIDYIIGLSVYTSNKFTFSVSFTSNSIRCSSCSAIRIIIAKFICNFSKLFTIRL